ncbi:MAG: hypothetical protein PVH61_00590 [Candidatus Aminicenantes bacterium]|jgi:hypothetical protein
MKKEHFKIPAKPFFNSTGLLIAVVLTLFLFPHPVNAAGHNDGGFIYGKITMKDGDRFQGPIRWGTEETFWHDMFNSTKEENEFSIYLSSQDMRELRRQSRRKEGIGGFFRRLFGGTRSYSDAIPTHQFVCRFGEIKKMEMRGRRAVFLTFKNGDKLEVSGGSNDINAKINILDREAGELTLKWNKIRMIEFMAVSQPLKKKFGEPLYGTVNTPSGQFKGFIQWDHQECVDTDKLDGDWENGDISIELGKIKSIEKYRRGSLVTLHSGKEYYLYGSNDVNDDNRGIVINDLNFGKIILYWDEFDQVEFEKTPALPSGYDDFVEPKQLVGKVETKNGKIYTGRIVYDLDEAVDFELISGEYDDIEYNIPLRNIETIVPLGSFSSKITMKNGKTIELENSRDVNGDNDGLLVWEDEEPVYIPWRTIRKIELN